MNNICGIRIYLLAQTRSSQGRLSVNELRAVEEESILSWSEGMLEEKDESEPASRDGGYIAREVERRPGSPGSSRRKLGGSHASLMTEGEEQQGGAGDVQSGRCAKVPRTKGPETTISPILPTPSPFPSNDVDGRNFTKPRQATSSVNGKSSSANAGRMGRRKNNASGSRRWPRREMEADAGASEKEAEPSALFEFRESLRAREEDILRLEHDSTASVVTSAASFKNLASSSRSIGEEEASIDSSDPRDCEDRDSHTLDVSTVGRSNVGGGICGKISGLEATQDEIESSAGSGFDKFVRSSREDVESIRSSSDQIAVKTSPPRTRALKDQEMNGAIKSGTNLSLIPRGSLQSSQESFSAPDKALAAGELPLVVSAQEGLRQMRLALKKRAQEVNRAKDGAGKMVSQALVQDVPTGQKHRLVSCSVLTEIG